MATENFSAGTVYADNPDGHALALLDRLNAAVVEADCLAKAWSAPDDADPMAFVWAAMMRRIVAASDDVEMALRRRCSVERAFGRDAATLDALSEDLK